MRSISPSPNRRRVERLRSTATAYCGKLSAFPLMEPGYTKLHALLPQLLEPSQIQILLGSEAPSLNSDPVRTEPRRF